MTEKFVTLPREVVEQVLKAAEAFHLHYKRNIFSGCVPSEELYFSAARASLRAALERPQVEQEPVAWVGVGSVTWDGRQSEKVEKLTREAQPEYGFVIPIYTHPQPKREPLTDEEIDKLCPQFDDPMRREMWIIGFKAAHNIK